MSDDQGRRRRSGGAGRWLTFAGWGAALLLAANLLWGKLHEEGGRPQGFLSERLVVTVAFWLPAAAAAGACALGIWWAVQAHARREKSSLVWLRNAFTGALVGLILVVSAAQQDPRRLPREWFSVLVVAVVAVVTGLFAYAMFREYRRATGHGGGRHGSGDEE